MRLREVRHGVEFKVDFGHLAGIHGGAESLPGMAAVDPAIGNAVPARRHMIVKQAFRRVKDIALGQAQIAHMLQHVHEIAVIGLVRADIFGGVDRVESGAERRVAEAEASDRKSAV